MEVSRVGGDWPRPGPTQLWMRLVVQIVAGEEPTPFQRVAAVSDFGNGIAAAFDLRRHTAINPDLTISLQRLPAGAWVGLDAGTYPEVAGHGVAESVLHDEGGGCGCRRRADSSERIASVDDAVVILSTTRRQAAS